MPNVPDETIPTPNRPRRFWRWMVMAIVGTPIIIFFGMPTSWLIPNAPLVRGSSGFMFSTQEVEPRWSWIRFHGKRAVPALREALLSSASRYARNRCAQLLGEMKDASAIPELAQALQFDDSADVRIAAASALADLNDSAAIPALIKGLRADKRSYTTASDQSFPMNVDKAICDSLVRYGGDDVVNGVAMLLVDGRIGPYQCDLVFKRLDGSKATPYLISEYLKCSDVMVRRSLVHCVGLVGDRQALPTLEQWASMPVQDWWEKQEIADAIERIKRK